MNKKMPSGTVLLAVSLLLISCSNNTPVQKYGVNNAKLDSTSKERSVMGESSSNTQYAEATVKQSRREQRILSHKERFTDMLVVHNKVREKHNVPPLKESKKLEEYSMQWAKQLSTGNKCEMYHRPTTSPFGENLYRSTAIVWTDGVREVNPVTIKDVVKAWTDEEKWYSYEKNSCKPGKKCGHYTQAVWKMTTEVGCAMQVCADKSQIWVCSYNPPGNYIGLRPY